MCWCRSRLHSLAIVEYVRARLTGSTSISGEVVQGAVAVAVATPAPVYVVLSASVAAKHIEGMACKLIAAIVIGKILGKNRDELHMELWLMSCRVLKRNMEYAMMDELVEKAKAARIKKILGYYYPTAKNAMVKDFYALQGFTKISEDEEGNSIWKFVIPDNYQKKQNVIEVNG